MNQLKSLAQMVLVGFMGFLLVNCQKEDAQKEVQLLTAESQNESQQLKAAAVLPVYMQDLMNTVKDMVAKGKISKGEGQSLMAKINSASNSLSRGNTNAFNGQMGSLTNEVDFMIESGTLVQEQGQLLLDETKYIVNLINFGSTNSFFVGNTKYNLNQGYNVWFSELDCGDYDIYAHGIYLTSDISISNYDFRVEGKALFPYGKGNIVIFNLFSKSSTLLAGKYIFVDNVDCNGKVTDGASTFTMDSDDKFVTAVTEPNDPTSYTLNVDLIIDWANVDLRNPSEEVLTKFMSYKNSRIGIKEGSVTVVIDGSNYVISFDCTDNNGAKLTGSYTGALNDISFPI